MFEDNILSDYPILTLSTLKGKQKDLTTEQLVKYVYLLTRIKL